MGYPYRLGLSIAVHWHWMIINPKDSIAVLQALALINDCNKYKMDLTTNGVVITHAIKFVQINKEKLTMSSKEDNGSKESEEPDYDEDKDGLKEKQEEETREEE